MTKTFEPGQIRKEAAVVGDWVLELGLSSPSKFDAGSDLFAPSVVVIVLDSSCTQVHSLFYARLRLGWIKNITASNEFTIQV